jgi:glutaredoxin
MNKIEIYTNETCPYCKQIKEELTKNNIEFKNKLTSDFKDEYQEIVNLTGIPTVPTIKYNDEYFVPGRDFNNVQQVINLLESFKPSKYTESRKIFERIKTLNFHINTAFGRVDQLLRKIETKLNTEEDEHKSTS